MPTAHCLDCGDLVREADIACAHCARPVDRRPLTPIHASNASLGASFSLEAQVCIVFGALAVMIAPFLPWAAIGTRSASGLALAGPAALLLTGLGLLALCAAISSMRSQRDHSRYFVVTTVVVAGGLSWLHYANLRSQVAAFADARVHLQLGPGLFVCAGGCLLLIVGLAGSLSRRR